MAERSKLACESCPVKDSAACAALDGDERAQLATLGQHVTLGRGETIFAAGEGNDRIATLVSGALKISSFDSEGNERILSLVHPAGFVGELFAPQAHHHVTSLTESKLCVFGRAQYEAAVERFPALALALLRRTSEDLLESRSLIDLASHRTAQARLAGLILSFSRAASHSPCHGSDSFTLPLTRGEMAGLLGMKIETVSRNLGKLERDGLIQRNGTRGIQILDAARLETLIV